MAITRAIVESHGGSLGCESDRQSTRFIIRLPRKPG
ncbi:hypothetical protein [Marinobacterium aestuariivivens]|uniref:Histidine kinase/HSP90-like ATPase domain-containing protein n=1 Tax=Marinobacterium aestuariivivens TaxID=1698799 RepID=A0ABW2A8B2_9GAMM